MVYAQVKNGIVKHCIVLDDVELIPVFSEGYDEFIRVDEMDPRPNPGWFYLEGEFMQELPSAPIAMMENPTLVQKFISLFKS